MNLDPYRSSMIVYVVDSQIDRGHQLSKIVSSMGYVVDHKLTWNALLSDLAVDQPQIVIFQSEDEAVFPNSKKHEERIRQIQTESPKSHVFFLVPEGQNYPQLLDLGVKDVITWPLQNEIVFRRSIDRSGETHYYSLLYEQVKSDITEGTQYERLDFGLFELWLKNLERCNSVDSLLDHWVREVLRIIGRPNAVFMQYLENKQTLFIQTVYGNEYQSLKGKGLDLIAEEPGFESKMLKIPDNLHSLDIFAKRMFSTTKSLRFSVSFKNQIYGIFLVPVPENFMARHWNHWYFNLCMRIVVKQLEVVDVRDQLHKYSIYDSESEAIHFDYLNKKIFAEVSRARRISSPVSLLHIGIDGYEDLNLSFPKSRMLQFLKAFNDVLVSNSRLNDVVGRVERERFLVCLPHTNYRGAVVKAERFRRLFETADFKSFFGVSRQIRVSIGVSEYPSMCHDSEGLISSSEKSMYEARRSGGNQVTVTKINENFTPDFKVGDFEDVSTSKS